MILEFSRIAFYKQDVHFIFNLLIFPCDVDIAVSKSIFLLFPKPVRIGLATSPGKDHIVWIKCFIS